MPRLPDKQKPKPDSKRPKRKEWTQADIDAATLANGGTPKGHEEKKRPVGRPSEYDKVNLDQARILAFKGFTDLELSEFFDVNIDTIHEWKKQHPEFSDTLKLGKDEADRRVERSLYERACGYSHPEEKVFYDSQVGMVVTHPTTKHYPPDPTSMIFWLKNRQKEKWREQPQGTADQPQGVEKSLQDIAQALQARDG